jgi:hypothetical protein
MNTRTDPQENAKERRRSRESFTSTLARLCERLSAAPEVEFTWNDTLLHETQRSRVRALRLWVAGSYARGSLDCGDLDLVVELKIIAGPHPFLRPLRRALFGHAPDVRFYEGTPEENSSRVAFPEARLVWSAKGLDWRAAIEAIEPDPEAARFARPGDRVPLRAEQLGADSKQLEKLVKLHETGLLSWDFVPIGNSVGPAYEADPDEVSILARLEEGFGKQTLQIMPHVVAHLHERPFRGVWSTVWPDNAIFDAAEWMFMSARCRWTSRALHASIAPPSYSRPI